MANYITKDLETHIKGTTYKGISFLISTGESIDSISPLQISHAKMQLKLAYNAPASLTLESGAAVTTTPTLLQWAIGVGATTDTLAGSESATLKVRRAIPMGYQYLAVAAPIGAMFNPVDINFDAPLVYHGGEWVQIMFRQPVGSATASEIYRVLAMVNGYFE